MTPDKELQKIDGYDEMKLVDALTETMSLEKAIQKLDEMIEFIEMIDDGT